MNNYFDTDQAIAKYTYSNKYMCKRSYSKTLSLKAVLNQIYGLYHAYESKKISVTWCNTNLKGKVFK